MSTKIIWLVRLPERRAKCNQLSRIAGIKILLSLLQVLEARIRNLNGPPPAEDSLNLVQRSWRLRLEVVARFVPWSSVLRGGLWVVNT